MDFRILGPLEVLDQGRVVALGGSKQRALLGVLLLHANETLSTDQLVDQLWPEDPPAAPAKTVQVHVSRLRKALAGEDGLGPIVTREHGYQLQLDPDRLDARRFERLVGDARRELAADRPERAAAVLEEARGMWRGAPLADLAFEPFALGEVARLADLRVAALELWIEARLALGAHAEVVGDLEALIGEHPYRERLRGQLMLALYRSDRQAEALQAYQDARRTLVEELGIAPGERLRDLEAAILAQDPGLAVLERPAGAGGARAATPSPPADAPEPTRGRLRSGRRLVCVLVADLAAPADLTEQLDPETLHELVDRCSEVARTVIERHGGTVEGYAGDATIGAFGLRELHEDDGLRAVRAAVELRAAGSALGAELGVELQLRFGAECGQVFVSPGTRRSPFATGDAFAVATGLQAGASDGAILLGDDLRRLLGDDVRVERLAPAAVRGRRGVVGRWRMLELEADGPGGRRASTSPFVGRERDLAALRVAFARVQDERTCEAVTVLGPAGIGKSRLARELAAELRDESTVAIGRCLSYGEGVTYRPLAEIVRQLGGDDPRAWVQALLPQDPAVGRLVLGAIGLAEGAAQADETSWAVRRLLERVAATRPLVVVVEDVHWAEPTLLDLLEHVAAFSTGHPILLLWVARPEFVDVRPGWAAPQPGRSLLVLGPLADEDARRLVEAARPDALEARTGARIVERAEGNPLFLEQLVAVGADRGEDALPSSIQAVLAARIDALGEGERAVLEDASVQGPGFHAGALAEEDGAATARHLVALVRMGLVRAERSEFPGQDAFRFAHALIREAAYAGLPKQRRAELHEHVAHWLERVPEAQDETIGFHLAEAHRHLSELGRVGDRERGLGRHAAERLTRAAGAALLRGDAPAGAWLLEHSLSLLEPGDPARAGLVPRLGAALLESGRLADADRMLTEAIDAAGDDAWLLARARVERGLVRLQAGSQAPEGDDEDVAGAALAVLGAHGDELGQCRALYLRAVQGWVAGRAAAADEDWDRAAGHARRAGDDARLHDILGWRASAALFGPTPVPEGIARCRAIGEQLAASPIAVARTFHPLAALHAMAGDLGEADRLVRAGDDVVGQLGDLQAAVGQEGALVQTLAGRPAAAEARLRHGYALLEEMGEKALLAGTAAMLAQALHAQDRDEEAEAFCRVSEDAAAQDDLAAQVGWRAVRAKLLARAGRHDAAQALAAEAVGLAARTDFLGVHAEALGDQAEVLGLGGNAQRAGTALRAALELHVRKGDVVSAGRVCSRLAGVAPTATDDGQREAEHAPIHGMQRP